jgi:hypothetical protein
VFDPALGDVQDFVPERWLRDGKVRDDLPPLVFGSGRKIFQGRVAIYSTSKNIAHLIWALDIDALPGKDVDPWAMVVTGFMTEPRSFKFGLRSREQ